jgi:hypothetical protein
LPNRPPDKIIEENRAETTISMPLAAVSAGKGKSVAHRKHDGPELLW